MSRKEKLIRRLLSDPKDFSWNELCALMKCLGYELECGAGSRRKFIAPDSGLSVCMHEPHPSGILKRYQVRDIKENLQKNGLIK